MREEGRAPVTVEDALEGVIFLLNPGPYGVSEKDPKAILIQDLATITSDLKVRPVVIGGIAVIVNGLRRQTIGVDLLVSRGEAVTLIRRLEASPHFSKLRIDRFRHNATGAGLDLCVEGELTSPHRKERFPSPADVEQLPRNPLNVVALTDLLALKVKSGRAQDEVDFIRLYMELGMGAPEVDRVHAKLSDDEVRAMLGRWHARAKKEIERDRLIRPPKLE
jgi:hypothetical protein